MNIWTQKSIELASQSNYLDMLYRVYPMSTNLRRELSSDTIDSLTTAFNNRDSQTLLAILLKQEIFPIKDSYVAYLKRDRSAIERNPAITERLTGILYEMGLEDILSKSTAPKETNRQIGPLFKRWINEGSLGVKVTVSPTEFMEYDGNIVFNGSDAAMMNLAREKFGYRHEKGLDFMAKFNGKFIIGEAKFLSDFGGHQNAQFNDAISTMKAELNTTYDVRTIAILDGVLYIKGENKMFKAINNNFSDSEVVISAVLLRDYLFSV